MLSFVGWKVSPLEKPFGMQFIHESMATPIMIDPLQVASAAEGEARHVSDSTATFIKVVMFVMHQGDRFIIADTDRTFLALLSAARKKEPAQS